MKTEINTTVETASLDILNGESIKEFASMLLDNGMQVFTKLYSSSKNPSYIHFSDGQNIGYAQENYYGGVSISTVHKPCKECGTGFGLTGQFEGIVNPTIEDAKRAFIIAPNWAQRRDVQAVRKYQDVNDYLSKPLNQLGETVFLTK